MGIYQHRDCVLDKFQVNSDHSKYKIVRKKDGFTAELYVEDYIDSAVHILFVDFFRNSIEVLQL